MASLTGGNIEWLLLLLPVKFDGLLLLLTLLLGMAGVFEPEGIFRLYILVKRRTTKSATTE
jgi:hypothetical protein